MNDLSPRDTLDRRKLLTALRALRRGDFSVRLPEEFSGVDGEIARLFNEVVGMEEQITDEFERLSLYHETTGGEAALARKRRDDTIRAGGHVYEAPPLAKYMTMATPAE